MFRVEIRSKEDIDILIESMPNSLKNNKKQIKPSLNHYFKGLSSSLNSLFIT